MIKSKLARVDTIKIAAAWRRVRTGAMVISGLGCVDYGAYQANHVAGWIATGISLLVLEWLTEDGEA